MCKPQICHCPLLWAYGAIEGWPLRQNFGDHGRFREMSSRRIWGEGFIVYSLCMWKPPVHIVQPSTGVCARWLFLFCARLHSVFVTHEVSFAIFLLIHQLNVCSEQVDEPTCSTPRRRQFNLPTIASIEELRTPAFEELLRLFWDMKSSKQANGDMKYVLGLNESAQSVRDSRLPLTAINWGGAWEEEVDDCVCI